MLQRVVRGLLRVRAMNSGALDVRDFVASVAPNPPSSNLKIQPPSRLLVDDRDPGPFPSLGRIWTVALGCLIEGPDSACLSTRRLKRVVKNSLCSIALASKAPELVLSNEASVRGMNSAAGPSKPLRQLLLPILFSAPGLGPRLRGCSCLLAVLAASPALPEPMPADEGHPCRAPPL
jgi:hypothetical protein